MTSATSAEHGMWTDTFEQLHHAATSGAPAVEVAELEAAEVAELAEAQR